MADYHVISGTILLFASFTGCILPFVSTDLTPIRPLSTGVVFAVALCHVLADAAAILDTVDVTLAFETATGLRGGGDVLPIAEALVCLGIFVMLVIDQCIPCHHHPHFYEIEGESASEREGLSLLPASPINNQPRPITIPVHPAKLYATEASIALHSVIIGFTIGVNPDTTALPGFTIAMIFHQILEGGVLGVMAVNTRIGVSASVILVGMFSASLPVGIGLGMHVYRLADGNESNGDEWDGSVWFQGVPNAVAGGMLLHIGFELLVEDFGHRHPGKVPVGKLALVFFGGATMCFLAVWA